MIIQLEKQLRIPSEKVELTEGNEIVLQLIEELEKGSIGVGLSAPQIGLLKQVAVIQTSEGWKGFINPVLTKKEEPFININEGCLSFPGQRINTIRYHKITVVDDLHGETSFSNFASVILQHETDHLNGVLLFDNEVPETYGLCFCGSGKKFKFCCKSKVL